MEDISMEEMEEDQDNIRLSPPRKRRKIAAESSSSKENPANSPQTLIPNHLRHKIDAHTGQCNSVLFLHNSDYLISAGKDNAIKFWDTGNGALTKSFEGFQGAVCDMAINKDNSLLVAGLTSRNLCICDLNSGQVLQTLKGHRQKVCAVDICSISDEYMIISTAPGDCTKLWSLNHDYPLNSIYSSRSNSNALCFAAENRMFCTGHDNGKIVFLNADRLLLFSW